MIFCEKMRETQGMRTPSTRNKMLLFTQVAGFRGFCCFSMKTKLKWSFEGQRMLLFQVPALNQPYFHISVKRGELIWLCTSD